MDVFFWLDVPSLLISNYIESSMETKTKINHTRAVCSRTDSKLWAHSLDSENPVNNLWQKQGRFYQEIYLLAAGSGAEKQRGQEDDNAVLT